MMSSARSHLKHRVEMPGHGQVEWTQHAIIRWMDRFATLSPEDAWDRAVFWGRYRGLWAWRIPHQGVVIAIPTHDAWRVLTYWKLSWWEKLTDEPEELGVPSLVAVPHAHTHVTKRADIMTVWAAVTSRLQEVAQ